MDKILYEADGDLGVITLNDPPLNVFAERHWDEMQAAVTMAARSGHRALLLKANGDNFSRGASPTIFDGKGAAEAREALGRYLSITHTLEALPIPVIAAVQGICQASGLELVLACDMIIAAQSARFAQPEAIIGATTFLGGAQRLARRCGSARALEIVYTTDMYDAATFERWNIVNRIVPDEALHREALTLAKRLAAGPTRAHGATKRMVKAFSDEGLAAADALILTDGAALWESEDMRAGVNWFLSISREAARPGGVNFTGR